MHRQHKGEEKKKKKKEGEEKEAWKGGENVERHKSGARGEPGSTAARAAFQAHRQRTRTVPARQGEHREATGLVPQRKGAPAPPGANSVWGFGSASQHTVIPMLKPLWQRKSLCGCWRKRYAMVKIRRVFAPFFPPSGSGWGQRVRQFLLNSPQMRAAKWKLAPKSCLLPTSLLQIRNNERGKAQCKPSFALTEGLQ